MRRTMLLATKHSKWARTEQKIDHRKDPFMALPVDLQAAPALRGSIARGISMAVHDRIRARWNFNGRSWVKSPKRRLSQRRPAARREHDRRRACRINTRAPRDKQNSRMPRWQARTSGECLHEDAHLGRLCQHQGRLAQHRLGDQQTAMATSRAALLRS
jgi:hypothetical protein